MTTPNAPSHIYHEEYPDTHHDVYSKTVFGFWLYLLTDIVFFGIFFAVFAVFSKSFFGGPTPKELFDMPFVFVQTLILLTATFSIGLGSAYVHLKDKKHTIIFYGLTFFLGLIFIVMQIHDFSRIVKTGYSWSSNAYLSAYFSLVGIHLLHMIIGTLWVLVLIFPVWHSKVGAISIKRLTCLKMFWQVVNIVWIFIFSQVYLLGVYGC